MVIVINKPTAPLNSGTNPLHLSNTPHAVNAESISYGMGFKAGGNILAIGLGMSEISALVSSQQYPEMIDF